MFLKTFNFSNKIHFQELKTLAGTNLKKSLFLKTNFKNLILYKAEGNQLR